MQQNLKVDIVYYDTPTDFELEFNLCGCCRMRLLTDKTDDQKLFLHMLARSVSRSRVILVFGKLFGNGGAINLVANSIGKNLETVDNSLYGIDSNDEIKIIEGSLPLVTDEGFFGGCIIESGPQTLVILSDNKNIRKSIMGTLIHPYIEQISHITPTQEKPEEINDTQDTISQEDDTVTDENEVLSEDSVAQASDATSETNQDADNETEENSSEGAIDEAFSAEETADDISGDSSKFGFVFDEDDEIENKEKEDNENVTEEDRRISSELYLEIDEENAGYAPEKYFSDTVYNEKTIKDFLLEDDDSYTPAPQPKVYTLNRIMLALIILLLVLVVVVCLCLFYFPYSQGDTPKEFLEVIFKTIFGK